jgi:hypothetical protein
MVCMLRFAHILVTLSVAVKQGQKQQTAEANSDILSHNYMVTDIYSSTNYCQKWFIEL